MVLWGRVIVCISRVEGGVGIGRRQATHWRMHVTECQIHVPLVVGAARKTVLKASTFLKLANILFGERIHSVKGRVATALGKAAIIRSNLVIRIRMTMAGRLFTALFQLHKIERVNTCSDFVACIVHLAATIIMRMRMMSSVMNASIMCTVAIMMMVNMIYARCIKIVVACLRFVNRTWWTMGNVGILQFPIFWVGIISTWLTRVMRNIPTIFVTTVGCWKGMIMVVVIVVWVTATVVVIAMIVIITVKLILPCPFHAVVVAGWSMLMYVVLMMVLMMLTFLCRVAFVHICTRIIIAIERVGATPLGALGRA